MRIYGNEKTSLVLTEKAFTVYSNTDPLRIIEHDEEGDERTYDIRGVIEAEGLTAAEVNEMLEELA